MFIYENKEIQVINVYLRYLDAENSIISEVRRVDIEKENYELLMSERPSFAPGKPANEYRECDLFYFVDLIRTANKQ